MSFFWVGHFEFFFRKKKENFCFILIKISPNLYGRMDGSKFWCFPWFPENSLLCVILCYTVYNLYTAIPYRASTGPVQGFTCALFPHREKPVFITGFPGDENRVFPFGKSTQGNPCFHYRGGFAVQAFKASPAQKMPGLKVALFQKLFMG